MSNPTLTAPSIVQNPIEAPNSSLGSSAQTTVAPRLTLRAVLLSLAFSLALGVLIPLIDFKFNNTYLGSQHFAPGAIGALMLLMLVLNPLLGVLNRRWCLSRDEILVVYLACLFAAIVPGTGGYNYWPSQIVGVFSTRQWKTNGSICFRFCRRE